MKITKTGSNILVAIILLTIVAISIWRANQKTKLIKDDFGLTNGIIVRSTSGHRGSVNVEYKFFYNDTLQNDETIVIYSGLREYFLNKTFPVIFSKKKPEVNEMLILPKDFEEYNLQYPDSLNWVKELIDKN